MAIPANMTTAGLALRRHGIRVAAYPSDPTFWVEVQIAPTTAFPTSRLLKRKFPPSGANLVTAEFEVLYTTKTWYGRGRHFKPGLSTGAWTTALVGDTPSQLVDNMLAPHHTATRISSLHTVQGSMLPNPSTLLVGNNMTYAGGGAVTAHMWLSWAWLSGTLYRPDGTTISVTGSGNIPSLGAPTLSQVAGGALGARTRFVRIALVKDHMLYMQSGNSEASLAIGANNLLKVTSPAAKAAFDGWAVLIGSASNAEFTQPGVLTALTFGSDFTEPVGGATVSGTTPWNANWGGDGAHNAITAVELAAGSTYLFYPTYDTQLANNTPGLGLLRMACALAGGPSTSTDPASAQLQVSDTRYAISYGSISGVTPNAGNTSSGNSGATTNTSTAKYL